MALPDYPFDEFTGELSPRLLDLITSDPVAEVKLPSGTPAWLVTGYEEARTVLTDARFARMIDPETGPRMGNSPLQPTTPEGRTVAMDGEGHLALRRLTFPAFTARRVETFRPRIQEIADELLDAMVAAGPPADLISAFTLPLPLRVTGEMLGVAPEDQTRFSEWADAVLSVTTHTPEQMGEAFVELLEYLRVQIDRKRRDPGPDLLSDWIAARDDRDELTETEIIYLGVTVVVAGHETTSSVLGQSVRQLLRHPDQLAALRADPSSLDTAVEELLRCTSMTGYLSRPQQATEDVELGGKTIHAGDAVIALPAAANRDPKVFAEPGAFDLKRAVNPHVAFGHGPHFCLGAALARVELQVALSSLLRRFPALSAAEPLDQLKWREGILVTGLTGFPVKW